MLDQYSQPEDLLADESFLHWYFKTGGEKDRAWEEWITGHQELVRQAVELLEATRLPERNLPHEQIDRAADRLLAGIGRLQTDVRQQDIDENNDGTGAAKSARILPLGGAVRWIAAACCLLLAGGVLYSIYHSRPSEIRTEYGQLGQQILPDGTEVTMNANSRLKLAPGWKKGDDREVWLSGEAFFHVSHTPEKSPFIVHLDHCDVIVLGTSFNVVNRPGKENIMLEEGEVALHAASGKVINMRPGDFVALNQDEPQLGTTRPDSLLAWKKRTIFLDSTPLREVINTVYEQYGVTIRLADDSLASKTFSGILPTNDLDGLLKDLELMGDVKVIRQEGGAITIAASKK
jgi:ferric-dicitrate binding protein FerR (iron transport regulator)